MKGTWQTTDSGGGGAGAAALVIGAAILAAAIAGPVVAAAVELVRLLFIAAAVILGLALAGGAAFVAYRVRQGRTSPVADVSLPRQVPWRSAEPLSASQRPAIEAPREVHIHFHGVTAEDAAAIVRRATQDG
jgi:hypothetical protein